MALTAGGTPYVESSDLVASYPATSLALANKVDTKLDNAPTDNAQSGITYTFVLADARQLVTATSASAKTFTIPPQSSVTWLTGTMIRVVNYGAGALTVDGGVGVTVTNTAATLAQYQAATAIRTGSNAWTLVPFSGGAGNANFSDTATGTYTDGGIDYKYITYNSSNTITITTAGVLDQVLVIGGGGGGGSKFHGGGGGAGAYLSLSDVQIEVGTYTVTVGAGGAGGLGTGNNTGSNGSSSHLAYVGGAGGGGGAGYNANGAGGGSGGGAGGSGTGGGTGGSYSLTFGNVGGATGPTVNGAGAGGGGAGGAGGYIDASYTATGGAGGAGLSSSITNTAVGRGGGGAGGATTPGSATDGGGSNANGTPNTGGGGSGGNGASANGYIGGSGVVIVRVKV